MIKVLNLKEIKLDKKILNKLIAILGKENVLFEKEDLYCYSLDVCDLEGKIYFPDAVVLPSTTEEVSQILKIAYENNIPITPRASGTNHVGGCVPLNAGIVVHLSKMDKIIEIDKNNLKCRVQAGVTVGYLQEEAEKCGLFYPPDPSNLKVSAIGGSIALSSSGPRCFKYGGTKDYVLGLKVVLANGEIINTGSNTAKNVTGYNLTQLFVGSEGTLGIVTEATLKLIIKPETQKVFLIYFNSIDEAANTVTEIISAGIQASTLDLIDKYTINTIETFYPSGLLTDKEAVLIVEIDGFRETIERQSLQINDLARKNGASDVVSAENEEETQRIWTARRSAFAAVSKLKPNVITEDTVVPRDKIPEMVKAVRKIADKYSLTACVMGHAGDGNIHPNFAVDFRDKDEMNRLEKAVDELMEVTLKLGGTLSGEHGIGIKKQKYLKVALGDARISYMKEIKRVFDPKNLMNPGKVI